MVNSLSSEVPLTRQTFKMEAETLLDPGHLIKTEPQHSDEDVQTVSSSHKKSRRRLINSSSSSDDFEPIPPKKHRSRIRRPRSGSSSSEDEVFSRVARRYTPSAEKAKRLQALEDMKKKRKSGRVLFKVKKEERVSETDGSDEEGTGEEDSDSDGDSSSTSEYCNESGDDFIADDNDFSREVRKELTKVKAAVGNKGLTKNYNTMLKTTSMAKKAKSPKKKMRQAEEDVSEEEKEGTIHSKNKLLQKLKEYVDERDMSDKNIIDKWKVFRTTITTKGIKCFCGDRINKSRFAFDIALKGGKESDQVAVGRECYDHLFDDTGVFDGQENKDMRRLANGNFLYLRLLAHLRRKVVKEDDLDDEAFMKLFHLSDQDHQDFDGSGSNTCTCTKRGIRNLFFLQCDRPLKNPYMPVIVGSECVTHWEKACNDPEAESFLPFLTKFFKYGVTAVYNGKDAEGMHLFELCGKHGQEIYEKFDVYSEEYDLPFERDGEAHDVIAKVNHAADNRFYQEELSTESVDEGEKYKVYFKSSVDRSREEGLPVLTFHLKRVESLKREEVTGKSFIM